MEQTTKNAEPKTKKVCVRDEFVSTNTCSSMALHRFQSMVDLIAMVNEAYLRQKHVNFLHDVVLHVWAGLRECSISELLIGVYKSTSSWKGY
jgi:hypothetical protein